MTEKEGKFEGLRETMRVFYSIARHLRMWKGAAV